MIIARIAEKPENRKSLRTLSESSPKILVRKVGKGWLLRFGVVLLVVLVVVLDGLLFMAVSLLWKLFMYDAARFPEPASPSSYFGIFQIKYVNLHTCTYVDLNDKRLK